VSVLSTREFYKYLDQLDLDEDDYTKVASIAVTVTPLLHYIPSGIPEFTDHGIIHSTNVLRYVRDIVKEYKAELTKEERFILALSAILHDIGCIVKREKHNEITIRILAKKQFDFLRNMLDPLFYRALEQVIIAHSKNFPLSTISSDPSPEIRLRVISTLFRLADACDMSASRVKKLLLEVLVEEGLLNKKCEEIWKSHLEIENVIIKKNYIRPQIYDPAVAEHCIGNLEEELKSINPILAKHNLPPFLLEPDVVERSILKKP